MKLNNNNLINNKTNRKHFILNLIKLRKFENNLMFKELINFICKSKTLKIKAYILTEFLKTKLEQLKNLKFFNFFFIFVTNCLKYFLINNKIVKGIKIIIKGNLTKKQRAVKKTLKIGKDINNSKINLNLSFHQSCCYTKKGTFGIKTIII